MCLTLSTTRSALTVAICGAALLLPGCGSQEVTYPRVTEESLTPEQKAQWERMQNAQGEAFRRAGMNQPVVLTPQEFAQQQFEAQKVAQENAKDDGVGEIPAPVDGAPERQ